MPETKPQTDNVRLNLGAALLLLFIVWVLLHAIDWTYRSIAAAWFGVAFSPALYFVLPNKYGIAMCCILGGLCLACAVVLMPLLSPTSVPVQKMELKNTTVAEALALLAKQRQEDLGWRFYVQDEDLADTPISLVVPEGSDLESAMDAISSRCGADWKWRWHKFFTGDPYPLCVNFYVFKEGSEAGLDLHNWRVYIDECAIDRFDESGKAIEDSPIAAEREVRPDSNTIAPQPAIPQGANQ